MTMPPQSVKKKDAGRIPGPAVIAGCIEVIMNWTATNGRIIHTILHGRNLGTFTPSAASAQTLFAAISGNWSTNLALYSPTASQLTGLTVRDMSASTNLAFLSTGAAVSGTSASPGLPIQTALVLTANIAARGRGAKGRAYLPNWATNADAGNGLAIGAVGTALAAFGTALLSNFSASGLTSTIAKPARAHYLGFTGTDHPARNAAMVDVNSWTARDLVFDTQRRRVQP